TPPSLATKVRQNTRTRTPGGDVTSSLKPLVSSSGSSCAISCQPVTAVVERVEIQKLRQGENLILGFSIGGGIDQDPGQNPFSEDKSDKGIYVTRISPKGPADLAGLKIGDKIMQVNGWDMTMVTHDQARKKLTKKREDVVRLLVTRKSLEEAVKQSKGCYHKP
uniref:Tax1-binding protein 3 n=1 Tax=Oreochromis niloticus TaxID=8128 RepID=A0A669EAD7_ORENI